MKKITLGFFAFAVISLLGVGMITAFPMKFGKGIMAQELTEEEQKEMQNFHDSLEEAINNKDFESWKSLMESQITKENFVKIIEVRENEEEKEKRIQKKKEKFCEQNNCSEVEEKQLSEHFIPCYGKMMKECPIPIPRQ